MKNQKTIKRKVLSSSNNSNSSDTTFQWKVVKDFFLDLLNLLKNKKIEEKDERVSYFDFENELKNSLKDIVKWQKDRGVYSIYLSLSRELLEKILEALNSGRNIEAIIEEFKNQKCSMIREINLDPKFDQIDAINFENYFKEENIFDGSFTDKVVELAHKYCNRAVKEIKSELESGLRYNDKEFLKEKVEALLYRFRD